MVLAQNGWHFSSFAHFSLFIPLLVLHLLHPFQMGLSSCHAQRDRSSGVFVSPELETMRIGHMISQPFPSPLSFDSQPISLFIPGLTPANTHSKWGYRLAMRNVTEVVVFLLAQS